MNHWHPLQNDPHTPYAEWIVYDFEPEKFSCGHDKTLDNIYEFTSNGYACVRCNICKKESSNRGYANRIKMKPASVALE